MTTFIDQDFLLQNTIAQQLYHQVVADLPIIDYHNHLLPSNLADNKLHNNIARLWVINDQYKHRAMRMSGVAEKYITGDATDFEKFEKWLETFRFTMGGPLFHWSMMEMSRIFDLDLPLKTVKIRSLWDSLNMKIHTETLGEMSILNKFGVKTLCTSDDLLADVEAHDKASQNDFGIEVKPSLRGDSILDVNNDGFSDWLNRLSALTGQGIRSFEDYKQAIQIRLNAFDDKACMLCDHAIDANFTFTRRSQVNPASLFKNILDGKKLEYKELSVLQSFILLFLSAEYKQRSWAIQLHVGAQRYTSSRLRTVAGSAGGYAGIGQSTDIAQLCTMLDAFEQSNGLSKIILFNLNPADNESFATLTGSFTEDHVVGKLQFGPAWWYNDHLEGIRKQLQALSAYGQLAHFIGMTTDSRSVLSFSRHDYFRRVLCNWLGEEVEKGHLPNDLAWLSEVVSGIAYTNSKHFFNI